MPKTNLRKGHQLMIRFLCVALFVILFLVLSIPLLIVEWILGKFNMDLKNRSSLAIVNWAFRVCLWFCGVSLTVIGEENVPKDTAVLYVGNHRSYFDILLTYTRVPRPTGYIAKKEMLRYPLLRDWMRNIHCLFLDRDNIKEGLKTILKGVEEVKSGVSMCIFPEGTRNKVNDTFLPFREGSFKIAEKGGVPVVPMTIVNSAGIFEDHLPLIRRATVIIEFGEPLYINELDKGLKKSLGAHVSGIIAENYFKIKEELPEVRSAGAALR